MLARNVRKDGNDPARTRTTTDGRIHDETYNNNRRTGRYVVGCFHGLGATLRSSAKRSERSPSSRTAPSWPPAACRRSSRPVASWWVRPLGRTDDTQPFLPPHARPWRTPKHPVLQRQSLWLRGSGLRVLWHRFAILRSAVLWRWQLHPSRDLPRTMIGSRS